MSRLRLELRTYCCVNPSFHSLEAQAYALCESCGSDVDQEFIRQWLRDHKFNETAQEYKGLMIKAATSYAIPGILDVDELYQEGLLILDHMFQAYDFPLESPDFRKMFKTELWHGIANSKRHHQFNKRDWRKSTSADAPLNGEEGASSWLDMLPSDIKASDEILEMRDSQDRVDAFIDDMRYTLDGEAWIVFEELLYPSELEPEDTEDYERVPVKRSMLLIARRIGFPHHKVKRLIKEIRTTATTLLQRRGILTA